MSRPQPKPEEEPDTSRMGVHVGRAVMNAATTYGTLTDALVEMVQNALDANAKHVVMSVDLHRRVVVVMDDGDGFTLERFHKALGSVFFSIKEPGKLGRWGLGMLSLVSRGTETVFISQPRGQDHANEWSMKPAAIEQQADNVQIPRRSLPALPRINPFEGEKTAIAWRTVIRCHGLKRNRTTNRLSLDTLEELVSTKLGPTMLRLGTNCRVVVVPEDKAAKPEYREIRPLTYTGEPFPVTSIVMDAAGEVVFELYRAPKNARGRQQGKVSFAEMDGSHPISCGEMVAQAKALGWNIDAFDAFASGKFEGLVRVENLILDRSRNKFEYNDALIDFYAALEKWYVEVGKSYFEEERERQRDQRLQELATRALDEVYRELAKSQAHLDTLREQVKSGLVGKPDAQSLEPPSSLGPGEEEGPDKPATTDSSSGGSSGGSTTKKPPQPKTNHTAPTGALGPDGRSRKLARHDGINLQLAHGWLEQSLRLWELDLRKGVVWLNSRNSIFTDCETDDGRMIALQKWVLVQVISLLMEPLEQFEQLRRVSDNQASLVIKTIVGTSSRRRKPS